MTACRHLATAARVKYPAACCGVFDCIDTDGFEKNTEHENAFQEIRKFCEKSDYDLIWFCHNVEEVFWGKRIPDSRKVQEAAKFRNNENIRKIPVERLSAKTVRPHTSNILCVLDQYLIRK